MLASADTIEMIAKMIVKHKIPHLVVDPVCMCMQRICIRHFPSWKKEEALTLSICQQKVMVSTSGAQLLPHEAIQQLSKHLLPHTTLLTPNIPEANLLLEENEGSSAQEIDNVDDLEAVARRILDLGPRWVLVKGGHLPFKADLTVAKTVAEREFVVDVLVTRDGEAVRVQSPYQESTNTHGTGCSLACKCLSTLLLPCVR